MIQDFIEAWINRKDIYKEWLESLSDEQRHWGIDYSDLVKSLIAIVINPYYKNDDYFEGYDEASLTIIDNGDYQGTLIFMIPEDIYQPSVCEYIYTYIYYGSCTCCDALQCAQSQLKEESINQLMTISLHLIENFKYLS